MDKTGRLQIDFIKKVQGIINEFEKQKLSLSGKICLWLLKRKMRSFS